MIKMMCLQEAIDLLGSPPWTKDFGSYCKALKKNFRKLIIKFHADKVEGDKEKEAMGKKLIEANSIISDAIETNELKRFLSSKIKEKVDYDFTKSQWDDDIFDEMVTVTDSLVGMLGSMKALLMSLNEGLQTVCFRGLRFSVFTYISSRILPNGEPERVWKIDSKTISKVGEIGTGDVDPLQLIFGG